MLNQNKMNFDLQLKSFKKANTRSTINLTRGGVTIVFSEMRGPNKIFGSFILQNEPNILFVCFQRNFCLHFGQKTIDQKKMGGTVKNKIY